MEVWRLRSTDLFEAGIIERMSGHFVRLLESAWSNLSGRYRDRKLLSEAEARSDP